MSRIRFAALIALVIALVSFTAGAATTSTSPYITKDSSGYTLHWTADSKAVSYDLVVPGGQHVTVAKTATSYFLGSGLSEPVTASVAPAYLQPYEQTSYTTPFTISQTLTSGQTISAPVTWQATPSAAVSKVEFYIDGALKWTEWLSPYVFNGDGNKLDPATLSAGTHTFLAKGIASSGATATVSASATTQVLAPNEDGGVKFYEYANPAMWNYASGGVLTQWEKDHWNLIEAYHPSWDSYTDDAPAVDYLDSSAIYKISDTNPAPQLPQFALKDADGNYVKFYGNTEYLADVGNPGWWDKIIADIQTVKNAGFTGVKLDDVNLKPIPHSTPLLPVNPRTGAIYTDADWQRDFANGLERVRAAFPKGTFTIIHNSVWFNQPLDLPDIARAAKACDIYEHERGAISNGDVTQLLAYNDQLHAWGVSTLLLASGQFGDTLAEAETNLAVALLGSDGTDWQYNEFWEPDGWWSGNDTFLGSSQGPRYAISGGLRRDFKFGYVTYDTATKVGKVVVP